MPSSADARASWLAHLQTTPPADRPRAEAAVRALYAAAGFPEPRHFFWFDSPRAASWAVAALVPREDRSSSQLLAPNVLSKEDRERLEHTRTTLRAQTGLPGWPDVNCRHRDREDRIASRYPERQRGIQVAVLVAGHEARTQDPSLTLGMTTALPPIRREARIAERVTR